MKLNVVPNGGSAFTASVIITSCPLQNKPPFNTNTAPGSGITLTLKLTSLVHPPVALTTLKLVIPLFKVLKSYVVPGIPIILSVP